jgi:hypothetical protein
MHSPLPSLDLSKYRLHACIDFVKVATPGKIPLPPLAGKPSWGVAAHHKELTVHDPHWTDLAALVWTLPNAALLDAEIAVDFFTADASFGDREQALSACFRYVSQHLYPYAAPFLTNAKTRAYDPATERLRPFNRRLPDPSHQLLYGLRREGPAQVKCYYKRWDQGQSLNPDEHRVRVEVRLQQAALAHFDIPTVNALIGFPFRKALSPYFRMVDSPLARLPRLPRRYRQSGVLQVVRERKASLLVQEAHARWRKTGVQGTVALQGLRLRRNISLNRRVGRALDGLESRLLHAKLSRHNLIDSHSSIGETDHHDTDCITDSKHLLPVATQPMVPHILREG